MSVPNQRINEAVRSALDALENRFQVRVLYACESGSRAWGFASNDSDYDVRFLYAHPLDWYLSVDEKRDVIELPLSAELDVNGWDLRKALRLLGKSNPALLEWLWSPVVYQQEDRFLSSFRDLAETCFSPRRCYRHYLHMAAGQWRQYLVDRPRVRLKKYFYVFRAVLGCRWIERHERRVPVPFALLLDQVLEESDVRAEIDALLARKAAGEELAEADANPVLHRFVQDELNRLESRSPVDAGPSQIELLDDFFRAQIREGMGCP